MGKYMRFYGMSAATGAMHVRFDSLHRVKACFFISFFACVLIVVVRTDTSCEIGCMCVIIVVKTRKVCLSLIKVYRLVVYCQ